MSATVLLIHCQDQPGLIYRITGVIFSMGLNIVSNGEFVERSSNYFFMRTEFAGNFDEAALLNTLKDVLPTGAFLKLSPQTKRDICILATREYHCLSDLLIRYTFNELNANIRCVISNYDNLRDLTEKFSIPYYYIPHEGKSRESHEAEIMTVLDQFTPEFIVLAKYMRVLSPLIISKYPDRIVNIHHSFLPAFVGASPYTQAYDRGVKIIGATAHFVNDHLDEGPIIAQSVIPVAHTHSAREMAQAGRDVEKIVLARSLKLVLSDRVFVYRNKTVIFD
jgi:formyltetrahydrofolate deformylase